MAGEVVAVHEAGSPPGDLGAHIGKDAAVTGAASPRQRGKSRTDGVSGDRNRDSVRTALENWYPHPSGDHWKPHKNCQNSLQRLYFSRHQ